VPPASSCVESVVSRPRPFADSTTKRGWSSEASSPQACRMSERCRRRRGDLTARICVSVIFAPMGPSLAAFSHGRRQLCRTQPMEMRPTHRDTPEPGT
jgi:hypothetical protein